MGGAGALPWLVCARQCRRRRWNADAGDAGYGGIAGAGTLYTLLWKFPAYARTPLSGLAAPFAQRDTGKKDD